MIRDKKIIKNFIWNTIGSIFNAFNSVIILVIITRINGLENAGIFSITFATASILYVLAIYSGRNCQITDIKGKITDKEYIIARVISCVITIIILIAYILLTGYDTSKVYILIALCIWKTLEAFSDVLYGILQKNDELYKVGVSLLLKSIIGIGGFIICDFISNNLNLAFSVLYIITLIIIIMYDIPNTIKIMGNNKKIDYKNIINIYKKEFWIFGNTFLIMFMLNEPKYVIEKYFNNDIQAIFNIILIPASIIPLFSQFIMAPIINNIKNSYKEKKICEIKIIDNKISLLILCLGLIATCIGYLIGIPILEWIYGQELNKYKVHFVVLLLSYILYAMAYVKTVILTTFRKLKEQFVVHLISTMVVITLSIILTNYFSIIGITTTYCILMLLYYFMLWWITKYNYKTLERK